MPAIIAREVGEKADLVIAFGSSLNYYTIDGGNMYPKAEMVQIDIEPLGFAHGTKSGDLHLAADAKLAAAAIVEKLRARRQNCSEHPLGGTRAAHQGRAGRQRGIRHQSRHGSIRAR